MTASRHRASSFRLAFDLAVRISALFNDISGQTEEMCMVQTPVEVHKVCEAWTVAEVVMQSDGVR